MTEGFMSLSRSLRVATIVLALGWASAARAQTTPTSVQVTWTAPGDDGSVGTATQYDLRYSTAAITATNFGSATRWNATPAPAAAGASQNVTVTGLAPTTTYYFAIKTADDAGNWSGISNIISKATPAAPDLTPPSMLAVSIASMTDSSATLDWTATGDDSTVGTATSYDVRYSTSPITGSNWATAAQATGEPAPAVAGTAQTFMVRSLSRQATYYFAVRVSDDAGNMSPLSNVPSGTTPDTKAPNAVTNLSANFLWLAWHSTRAALPRSFGGR
jgi:hypothetical protein